MMEDSNYLMEDSKGHPSKQASTKVPQSISTKTPQRRNKEGANRHIRALLAFNSCSIFLHFHYFPSGYPTFFPGPCPEHYGDCLICREGFLLQNKPQQRANHCTYDHQVWALSQPIASQLQPPIRGGLVDKQIFREICQWISNTKKNYNQNHGGIAKFIVNLQMPSVPPTNSSDQGKAEREERGIGMPMPAKGGDLAMTRCVCCGSDQHPAATCPVRLKDVDSDSDPKKLSMKLQEVEEGEEEDKDIAINFEYMSTLSASESLRIVDQAIEFGCLSGSTEEALQDLRVVLKKLRLHAISRQPVHDEVGPALLAEATKIFRERYDRRSPKLLHLSSTGSTSVVIMDLEHSLIPNDLVDRGQSPMSRSDIDLTVPASMATASVDCAADFLPTPKVGFLHSNNNKTMGIDDDDDEDGEIHSESDDDMRVSNDNFFRVHHTQSSRQTHFPESVRGDPSVAMGVRGDPSMAMGVRGDPSMAMGNKQQRAREHRNTTRSVPGSAIERSNYEGRARLNDPHSGYPPPAMAHNPPLTAPTRQSHPPLAPALPSHTHVFSADNTYGSDGSQSASTGPITSHHSSWHDQQHIAAMNHHVPPRHQKHPQQQSNRHDDGVDFFTRQDFPSGSIMHLGSVGDQHRRHENAYRESTESISPDRLQLPHELPYHHSVFESSNSGTSSLGYGYGPHDFGHSDRDRDHLPSTDNPHRQQHPRSYDDVSFVQGVRENYHHHHRDHFHLPPPQLIVPPIVFQPLSHPAIILPPQFTAPPNNEPAPFPHHPPMQNVHHYQHQIGASHHPYPNPNIQAHPSQRHGQEHCGPHRGERPITRRHF